MPNMHLGYVVCLGQTADAQINSYSMTTTNLTYTHYGNNALKQKTVHSFTGLLYIYKRIEYFYAFLEGEFICTNDSGNLI
jgi:hypothetical protein